MKKIVSEVGELWVGYHAKLGPVVYNALTQRGVGQGRVRLYKLDERSTGTFVEEIVRDKLVAPDDALWSRMEPAVAQYVAALAKRRVTHCFSCKQHLDSVELSLCDACGWIRCSCSACGCSYNGPGRHDL